jgi:two-component system KDP operon response regulator KdpE
LEIDFQQRLVVRDGVTFSLSPREAQALAMLVKGAGTVLTHGQILSGLSGRPSSGDVKYLRVLVGKLRQKVERDPGAPVWILTEAGIGYSFGEGGGLEGASQA